MSIYTQIKTCSKCGIDKTLSEFYPRKDSIISVRSRCKKCSTGLSRTLTEKDKKRQNEYRNNKKKSDSVFKLKCHMRTVIWKALNSKGYKKGSKTSDILGCDWNTLKEHIQSKFDDNMTWDNHGVYWDIDHVIPLSIAKTEDDVIKLNHYSNLQPLESNYNRNIKRHHLIE